MTCSCSSCQTRAGWSEKQRDLFDRCDDAAFAREELLRAAPAPSPELEADLARAVAGPRRPPKRADVARAVLARRSAA